MFMLTQPLTKKLKNGRFIMSSVSFLKKMFIVACVLLTFGCVGCSPSEADLKKWEKYNIDSLSKNGEEVGVLPDGRKVIRYSVAMPSSWSKADQHFIYVVDGSVTMNREIQNGKYTKQETTVLIGDFTECID